MSRQKGKSGSTKPLSGKPPSWISHSSKETTLLVEKLAKNGHSTSKIGIILRDNYGIPDVKAITGKKISKIINKQELPEELINQIKKIIAIKKHIDKNNKDNITKKTFQNANSKLQKIIKYYKKENKLPEGWKYKPEEAEKLV